MSMMPDPTFYPSPGMAMQAAPERIAYVALLNVGKNGKRDAMGVIDVDPSSPTYGQFVGQVDFPNGDNELHHSAGTHAAPASAAEPASAHGALLPGCAGHRVVKDSYPGYESGPQPSQTGDKNGNPD